MRAHLAAATPLMIVRLSINGIAGEPRLAARQRCGRFATPNTSFIHSAEPRHDDRQSFPGPSDSLGSAPAIPTRQYFAP
jgi:hypothetical protein